jgi:flagellar biosynthetic protein FliQ
MSQEVILTVIRDAVWTVILAAAPPLLMGLIVGLTVSLFQTITSIQEATLAFVPKIVAVFLSMLIFGGWIINVIRDFFINLYEQIPFYILGG